MNGLLQDTARVALIGVGATAAMDLWLLLLKRLGVPTADFALVGRWVGHALRGRPTHASIARAAPIPREAALGWAVHYAVGVALAAVLVAFAGVEWTRDPTWPAALAVGIGSVVLPYFVMQPAMGAGIAASKTAAPLRNAARSAANHAVFGLGLYLSATLLQWSVR
jgi:hypothetical protein